MDIIQYLKSPRILIAISIRLVLAQIPIVKLLDQLPFASSQFFSYDKTKEALFLIDYGYGPYDLANIFQVHHEKIIRMKELDYHHFYESPQKLDIQINFLYCNRYYYRIPTRKKAFYSKLNFLI